MLASAATLSIAPASVSVPAGEVVSVSVMVSSADSINAATGLLSFPNDLVSVVGISHSSSAFTLWVQEPTYSNAQGSAEFSGIVPNPGVTGRNQVLTIQLRGKKVGSGTISFSSGQVLANDGNGTDVFSGSSAGTITVTVAREKPTTPQPSQPAPQVEKGMFAPPEITDYRDTLQVGEPLVLKGTSGGGKVIALHFTKDSETTVATTSVDASHTFGFIGTGYRAGLYAVYAIGEDGAGRESERSNTVFVQIVSGITTTSLGISMPLWMVVAAFLLLLVLLWIIAVKKKKYKKDNLISAFR